MPRERGEVPALEDEPQAILPAMLVLDAKEPLGERLLAGDLPAGALAALAQLRELLRQGLFRRCASSKSARLASLTAFSEALRASAASPRDSSVWASSFSRRSIRPRSCLRSSSEAAAGAACSRALGAPEARPAASARQETTAAATSRARIP